MFFLILLLFLLVCGGLAALTIFNFATQVHIVFLSWQSPDLPIGLWMLMAFFLGALLLYFVSVTSAWADRREIRKLRKHNLELQQHILELQQQAIVSRPPAFVAQDNAYNASMPMPNSTPPYPAVQDQNLTPENSR
jgi:uncharacterized integral membrane protein